MDAEASLLRFTEYTNSAYQAAEHHALIAAKLEAVERGECKRLMILTPPRHGKSELGSRRFPAWCFGRKPLRQIIAATYNGELAGDFGRDVRNIVDAPSYRAIFEGIELAPDSTAANRWHTKQGGAYVAAGVGTAITGRGADILLIDDPVKDREDADSETIRKRVWDWYTSTAYTRLMPDGAIVLIQTRWHDDDLAGRILRQVKKGLEHWEVLSLQAIKDEGTDHERALWPAWYPLERLHQVRGVIGGRDWSALFQQEPAPETGTYFQRSWIKFYDPEELPKHLRIYGASDYAVTEDGGDYTVHGVAGVTPEDDLYVVDWWRDQKTSLDWVEAWCDLVLKWKPQDWAEEKGQIAKGVGPFLKKRSIERKAYCVRTPFASSTDKKTRAQSIRGRTEQGKVYLPRNAPWTEALVSELVRFDAGVNDDQVDVMSLFGRLLETMVRASVPKPVTPPKLLQEASFDDLIAATKGHGRSRI